MPSATTQLTNHVVTFTETASELLDGQTAVIDAASLVLAAIDADDMHTNTELVCFRDTFLTLNPDGQLVGLDGVNRNTNPTQLRTMSLADGRADGPLPAGFLQLVAADRRDDQQRAFTYYLDAMALVHAAVSLDSYTSKRELAWVAQLRRRMLDELDGLQLPTTHTFRPTHHSNTGVSGSLDGSADAPGSLLHQVRSQAKSRIEQMRHQLLGDTNNRTTNDTAPDTTSDTPADTPQAKTADSTADASGGEEAEGSADVEAVRDAETILAELDQLIGLDDVKEEVRLVADLLIVNQLRAERGMATTDVSYHLVFTGNPGTGKTTVARLVAELYHSLGVCQNNTLVETDRSELVAGFVGQTATKTREVCDKARGGLLLIDEAYALARGNDNDFGREAIDTLVKYMEDHRDDIIVIAAGYPQEMSDLLDTNPGLRSRFPKSIHFDDYTTQQLLDILDLHAQRRNFTLTDGGHQVVADWLDTLPRDRGFGNGRLVRNVLEAAIAAQATRLAADVRDPDTDVSDRRLTTITKADAEQATERAAETAHSPTSGQAPGSDLPDRPVEAR